MENFLYHQFNPIHPSQCTIVQQGSSLSSGNSLSQSYDDPKLKGQQVSPETELDFSSFAFPDFVDFSNQPTVSYESPPPNCSFDHSDHRPIDEVEQDGNQKKNLGKSQTQNRDLAVTKKIFKEAKPQAQARKKRSQENLSQSDEESSQNEHRNIPGALFGGLLKKCKKDPCSFLDCQKSFSKSKIEKFVTQSDESYKRNQKTFNSIALFALSTEDEEVASLALLIEFLKSEHHFFEFVRQSKMAPKRKEFLCEENSRGLYIKKFELAFQYVKDCLKNYKSEGSAVLEDKWNKTYKKELSNKIREQKIITLKNY